MGVLGAIALCFFRESARRPLPGAKPAVATEAEARELVEAGKHDRASHPGERRTGR